MSRTPEDQRNAMKTLTPLITTGVTFAVRKSLTAIYKAKTGREAPTLFNREASIASRVLWSAAVAGFITLAEVIMLEVLQNLTQDEGMADDSDVPAPA
jgi:hypothetical protein